MLVIFLLQITTTKKAQATFRAAFNTVATMPIGKVRSAVQALAPYRPGKAAKQAEEEHGISDAIKLASNENPYAPVGPVIDAVAAAANGANRYGDHRASELRGALAKWVGVDPSQIAVGCGSVGLLQQLGLVYIDPGDEVVFPWPSFEAYPIVVQVMGGTAVKVPLVEHGFDMATVAKMVTDKTKMILLATPNNPTGTAVSTTQIETLMKAIPNNVIVVVDEAYKEFADPSFGDPVTDLLPHYRNLVITRTFSKAYGLAGLRVGYAITDPEIVAEVDKVLIPFAVNNAAQAGALAALDSLEVIGKNIAQILAERTRVVATLRERGWKLPDAQANFVYLPLGEEADKVHLELEQQGVVTRPFSGEGIRITIGSESENDRLLASLGNPET